MPCVPKEWSARPVRATKFRAWWKKSTGEACPHGLEIIIVNGPYVRNRLDSDFSQGANSHAYPGITPKNELWVDEQTPEEEIPFVAFHECYEAELMRKGASYGKAHDAAKALEDEWRKICRPGERRR